MAWADLLVERLPMDQLLSEQHQTDALLADPLEPELLEEVSEFEVHYPHSRLLPGCEHVTEHEYVLLTVDPKNKEARRQVVQRNDGLLTPEETKREWAQCCHAMRKEIQTWVDINNISRKPREKARNIIDTRWVLKWKWDTPTSVAHSTDAKKAVRVIRARLTLRGP